MAWWLDNRLRLVQNNLRESDCNLDTDKLFARLRELSVNAVMLNAGGIVAFYPTQLQYHYRAAGQRKDLLQEAIDEAHRSGMRFIARFDFSKAHESIYEQKPEWFYRTHDGRAINYHGIVHTCVNGGYQREYALKIIDEVITKYEVDGIFFNMFGYQRRDYTGNDYGDCCCDNCRSRFRELYGRELPEPGEQGEALRLYREFQDRTTKEMLDRIHELVKSRNPEIAISTYSEHRVDIVRKESNTDKERPLPLWPYSASENVKSLEDGWPDKTVSNCCINAIDLVHRFTGVSANEVGIRLRQSIASGSGLDFCIIGVFEDYPDRENLPVVAEVFDYHRQNEAYYGRLRSVAGTALVKPGKAHRGDGQEYLGIFKMLKEAHVLFDVIHEETLVERLAGPQVYDTVIVPDLSELSDRQLDALEAAAERGAALVATGRAFSGNAAGRAFLERRFGARYVGLSEFYRESSYLRTDDKTLLGSFAARDWIALDGAFARTEYLPGTQRLLPLVIPSTYGPPERAQGHAYSVEEYGAGLRSGAKGAALHLPWLPGSLYYRYGYDDYKRALTDLLEAVAKPLISLTTNLPASAEIFFDRLDERRYLLQVLNLSGFNGMTFADPLPLGDGTIELRGVGTALSVSALPGAEGAEARCDGATVRFSAIGRFAAWVLEMHSEQEGDA